MLTSSSVATGPRRTDSGNREYDVESDQEGVTPNASRQNEPVELVGNAVRAAVDRKAIDVVVLDMGDLLSITGYFVICSGTSDRQVRTIVEAVERRLREEGVKPLRREGRREGGWVLLDYGDFVVHVFGADEREYYDLERLWKDAPRVVFAQVDEATG